jgi:7,8-dihydro-6-hydroxymethylpterin dimethyltransferase
MKILNKTESICDICLKRIPAETYLKDGRVFIRKYCPVHGNFSGAHAWDDPEIYQGLEKMKTLDAPSAQVAIALTYRCNLHCPVCYAKANEVKIEDFKFKDLEKTKDFRSVFLTGGEPTIRQDLHEIISYLKESGKKVLMFSNGLKLSNFKYAKKLKKAGLDCVFVQFDSTDDKDQAYIRGKKITKYKKKAVENMQKCGITIYFCAAMLKGKSFNHLKGLFDYAKNYHAIKNITINELWKLGRFDEKDYVPSSEIIREVSNINGITNYDLLQTTELLCNLDKLLAMFSPNRRRLFCRCTLKCLVLHDKNKVIPITKIIDTEKINKKIKNFYERESKFGLSIFLIFFLFNQIILGFILNKNLRTLIRKMAVNSIHLLKGNYSYFNPLYLISVAIFLTPRNMDFSFADQCNFRAVSSEDFNLDQGCLHRIKAFKKMNL